MSSDKVCSRRLFLLASATSFAGLLAACSSSSEPITTDATDVPEGSAIIIDNIIFAQPSKGIYKAYSTRCPHQGNKISIIEGEYAICPSHDSIFNLSDGSVVSGPARTGMTPVELSNEGTTLIARN